VHRPEPRLEIVAIRILDFFVHVGGKCGEYRWVISSIFEPSTMSVRLRVAHESRTPGHKTECFVRLFAAGQSEVVRYILALVPDMDDAQEVLQETAVVLWNRPGQYDPDRPFVPWTCRFAYFQVLKFRDQQSRRRCFLSLEAIDQLAAERADERAVLDERRGAPARCLKLLSYPQRLMIEQRYSRRMPVAQLFAVTRRSIATLYKALERLRRRLFECVNRRLGLEGVR
jgi:RNA polymerase sigma-70 factor (ECF subfamily)